MGMAFDRPFQKVPRLVDVQKPDHEGRRPSWKVLTPRKKERVFTEELPPETPASPVRKKASPSRWFLIPVFLGLSLAVVGTVVWARSGDEPEDALLNRTSSGIEQGVEAMRSLDFSQAETRFATLATSLSSSSDRFDIRDPWAFLRRGKEAFQGVQSLLSGYAELASLFMELSGGWPEFFSANGTGNPIALLEKAVGVLKKLENSHEILLSSMKDQPALAASSGSLFGDTYDLGRVRQFLESLTTWLKGGERHVAVLFLNNSELRPGGGFLGSYAHVTLRDGRVVSTTIHDINEPDRLFEENIVPPKAVQTIARRWRAADSNWFFDFGQSSEKTLAFLEKSKLYSEPQIKFDGVIAITPRVVSDILKITGPLTLEGRSTPITSENVVYELQRDIQEARSDGQTLPKGILGDLYQALGSYWKASGVKDKAGLAKSFFTWMEKKDLMMYARDRSLSSFLESSGLTGSMAKLQPQQAQDYLAVVRANLGGAKTDLVMKDDVVLHSQLDVDGTVRNQFIIERHHQGTTASDPWHQSSNVSYIRVLTPPTSELETIEGVGIPRKSTRTYGTDFNHDSDVSNFEKTFTTSSVSDNVTMLTEGDARGYAFWVTTAPGKTSKVVMDYRHRLPVAPHSEMTYELIFDKQSGVNGTYRFEIAAPVGYRWRENGLAVFKYETTDPAARVALTLTLEVDQ